MSKLIQLGNTKLIVPRICIGTGTMAFLGKSRQGWIFPKKYAAVLHQGYENGLTFWDTSDDYGTHPHIKETLINIPRSQIILTTKSHASTADSMRKSITKALKELNTSYIDIFLMHAVDSIDDLNHRLGALEELHNLKKEGIIHAAGLSTHSYPLLLKAVSIAELDVILTNFNKFEVHMDASLEAYTKALEEGYNHGKGIIVMKTLGEGRVVKQFQETLQYNLSKQFIHSAVVGITTSMELEQLILFWKSFA